MSRALIPLMLVLAAGAVVAASAKDDGRVYRWVDERGVVHYGDRVPQEFAGTDRDVLNDQAVRVDSQIVTPSPEAREAAADAEARREAEARAKVRDEILLDTYLSVEEIEALRDQRMEMLDAQIRITEMYLASLREKLARLQAEAARFRPYSADPEAPPIHENLARELSDTLESIMLYEKNRGEAKERQAMVVQKFAADISRFKELKGLAD